MTRILLSFVLILLFKANLLANPGKNSTINPTHDLTKVIPIQSITGSDNQNFIFWEIPSTIENDRPQFFLQRIKSSGESMWGKDVELSEKTLKIQSAHKIVSDGAGGVIIAWEARRDGEEDTDLYIQRIDSTGKKLWGEEGSLVSRTEGSQITPFIIADNFGGAFIAWSDSRNDPGYANWDIYAQHFNANGHSQWEEEGLLISADQKDEFIGSLLPSSDGGFIIVWNMVVPDISSAEEGYDFYSKKLDEKGRWIPSINSGRFLALPSGRINYSLGTEILNDGSDGFFLSLISNQQEQGSALYIQHVLSNGAAAFKESGVLIDNAFADIQNLNYETDSLGNYVFSWSGKQDTSLLTCISKFDRAGNAIIDTTINYLLPEMYAATNESDSLDLIAPLKVPKYLPKPVESPPVRDPVASVIPSAESPTGNALLAGVSSSPATSQELTSSRQVKALNTDIKYVDVPVVTVQTKSLSIIEDYISPEFRKPKLVKSGEDKLSLLASDLLMSKRIQAVPSFQNTLKKRETLPPFNSAHRLPD